jgi:hypothetical protein
MIFDIFDLILSDWVSFLAYPNLFEIKDFVVIFIDSYFNNIFLNNKSSNNHSQVIM